MPPAARPGWAHRPRLQDHRDALPLEVPALPVARLPRCAARAHLPANREVGHRLGRLRPAADRRRCPTRTRTSPFARRGTSSTKPRTASSAPVVRPERTAIDGVEPGGADPQPSEHCRSRQSVALRARSPPRTPGRQAAAAKATAATTMGAGGVPNPSGAESPRPTTRPDRPTARGPGPRRFKAGVGLAEPPSSPARSRSARPARRSRRGHRVRRGSRGCPAL